MSDDDLNKEDFKVRTHEYKRFDLDFGEQGRENIAAAMIEYEKNRDASNPDIVILVGFAAILAATVIALLI